MKSCRKGGLLADKSAKVTELGVGLMQSTTAASVELNSRLQRRRETTSGAARVPKALISIRNNLMERSNLESPKNHFNN